MRTLATLLATIVLIFVPRLAHTGPNENGVIILHEDESLAYTDGIQPCGLSGLADCNGADVVAELTGTHILHVFAAFPAENSPRLAGIIFGVEFDTGEAGIADYGSCGDFELPTGGWPAPGEGTAITWNEAQTDHLVEIYWFAAYSSYGNPSIFALAGHVTRGGAMADDSVPALLDEVVDFGQVGFGMEGYLPCPDPPTPVEPSSWGRVKGIFGAR